MRVTALFWPAIGLAMSGAVALAEDTASGCGHDRQNSNAPADGSMVCEEFGVNGGENMPEISQELCERFAANGDQPDHRETVIITLAPGADPAMLSEAGVRVTREMRNLNIVVGELNAEGLQALSNATDIIRIEPDSDGMSIPEQ